MTKLIKLSSEWDLETIQKFWNYISQRTDLHYDYFSNQVGRGLVNFLHHTGHLKEGISVLDYGCGPGFLVQNFFKHNLQCYATDSSSESVNFVNQSFKDHKNWMGATVTSFPPAPYPDESFDLITCIETVEHLLESALPVVISEIYRLLKPGGIALFTTPNNENLLHNQIFCPFCETEFHRYQHLRNFSQDSLQALLETHGFNTLFCQGINFEEFQKELPSWKDWNIRILYYWLKQQGNRLLDRLSSKSFPYGYEFRSLAVSGPHLSALVQRPLK